MRTIELGCLSGLIAVAAACGGSGDKTSDAPIQADSAKQDAAGDALVLDSPQAIDSGIVDAAPDAFFQPDAAPGLTCYGTRVRVCFATAPTGAVTIDSTTDTTNDGRCITKTQSDGSQLCVIAGATITGSDTIVIGSRPLVLVATDTISLGAIDVSAAVPGEPAGANPAACSPGAGNGAAPATAPTNFGGGGAGGTLATSGANGGVGHAGSTDANAGLAIAATAVDPLILRGGCAGGTGSPGVETPQTAATVGGIAGGAIALIAGGTLTVTSVTVDGGPGQGGTGAAGAGKARAGGGGGASGGFIELDGETLGGSVTLSARGGGGGGGGGATAGKAGVGTAGGAAGTGGGKGGAGGSQSAGAKPTATGGAVGANSNNGGGGGGGGDGVIQIDLKQPLAMTTKVTSDPPVVPAIKPTM